MSNKSGAKVLADEELKERYNEHRYMNHFPVTDMTLRDYFAAQAMPFIAEQTRRAIVGEGEQFDICNDEEPEGGKIVAEYCYVFADAMMRARL